MRKIYGENTANFPRLDTDVYFADYNNSYNYNGFTKEIFDFVCEKQLLNPELWHKFVAQFIEKTDLDNGWRCEFWGKMMRGASFVFSYSKDKKLFDILKETVLEMIDVAEENGRISTYPIEKEFDGWDLWGRKYVLLGMQYFLEVSDDKDLNLKIISSMKKQVDYIISKIGKDEGKKEITLATRHWRGLNSCSILEPIVRLYSLTKEKRYLDFAEYIVSTGATDISNIFDLAYDNDFSPYQYPVTKAYEMTSCFEGLLEYYRITKNERHKIALINFADKIIETDLTVIGCSGCTNELFDHSKVRQANTTNDKIMQETCVTVTIMKFMFQMHLLTGNSKYADVFETAFYNAYLGSLNTEDIANSQPGLINTPLPFDSYSPLTSGTRGNGIGGLKVFSDKTYYGCCACIGSAGIGLVPKMQLLSNDTGFVMNLFIDGCVESVTPNGNKIKFITTTDYPKGETISIKTELEKPEEFTIMLRNPSWNTLSSLNCNKEICKSDGYYIISGIWNNNDEITYKMDMRTEVLKPIPYGSQILMNKVIWGHNYMVSTFDKEDPIAKNHIALRRGPIMLAQDNRLGYSVDTPIEIKENNGFIDFNPSKEASFKTILEGKVPLKNGEEMLLVDYSSAGKLWNDESKMAVWILTK